MRLRDGFAGQTTEAQEARVMSLTDNEMEHLASKIGSILMDHGDYWMAIDLFLEDNNHFELDPHGDICTKYNEPALPDEDGNCSLCGAKLEPEVSNVDN
jgi:hypothetical protein